MSQEFLKGFLDKIGNEIEYRSNEISRGTSNYLDTLSQSPGAGLVQAIDAVETVRNPLVTLINNPIREAVGRAQLKNNKTILSERTEDGSFKLNIRDAFGKVNVEDKKRRAENYLKNSKDYRKLNNIGFSFKDKEGNLLSNDQINTATNVSQLKIFDEAIAEGVDLSKIDLTKANQISLTKEVKNKLLRDKAAEESVDTTGLSIPQIKRQTAEAERVRKIRESLEDPLTKASLDNTRSLIQQRSDQTGIQKETLRLDNLNRGEDRRLQASQFNRNYALQLQQAQDQAQYNTAQLEAQIEQSKLLNEQANLDRERLNAADEREYRYKLKELEQRRFDDIFNAIGGLNLY